MRKRIISMAILPALAIIVSGVGVAEEKAGEKILTQKDLVAQTICPVMGGEIDTTIFADHQGQRVYFCCAWCIDKFREDPEASFSKAAEGKILYHSIQTVCPVSGDPIDKEHFRFYKGRGLFFCGEECALKFDSQPDKYLEKMVMEEKKAKEGNKDGHGKEGHDHQH